MRNGHFFKNDAQKVADFLKSCKKNRRLTDIGSNATICKNLCNDTVRGNFTNFTSLKRVAEKIFWLP